MRPYQRTLTATAQQGSYAGVAKEDKIDIPRDYLLQRALIDIRGTLDITGMTAVEDAGQRLLEEVRVEIQRKSKSQTVIFLSGVDLYFINFYDNEQGLERVVPTGNGAGQAFSLQFCIDFRLAKNDPDDYSVAIPTYDCSSVVLALKWYAVATGYGTGTSNVSFTAKITLFEGIPESGEEYAKAKMNPIISLVAKEITCNSNTGEEERNDDVSVGNLKRRLFVIARTSGNLRSDTEIDYVSMKIIDVALLDKVDWDSLSLQDEIDYNIANYDGNRGIKGMVCFDFARGAVDEKGRVHGLPLIGLKQGDFKLTLYKNNASSKIRYINEIVEAVA